MTYISTHMNNSEMFYARSRLKYSYKREDIDFGFFHEN